MNGEIDIENAILDDPGALGYPDALAIRRCRIGQPSGLVDIVLLPRVGHVDLVLVEAKATAAANAAAVFQKHSAGKFNLLPFVVRSLLA